MKSIVIAVLWFGGVLSPRGGIAQERIPLSGPVRDTVIDDVRRANVVDTLISQLSDNYIFPEKIPALAAELKNRLQSPRYRAITSATAYADTLTTDLQKLIGDKHLRVRYTDRKLPKGPPVERKPTTAEVDAERKEAADASYGLGEVKLLDGNIGYMEVKEFGYSASSVKDGYAAAMEKLADADALIFDIRSNRGGTPFSLAILASYLFDGDSILLNSIYWRSENKTDEIWTHTHVAGRQFGRSKPVFVLVSDKTFSAAEEFAYDLQSLKRAKVVGVATRGGANPGGGVRLDDHFFAFVPSGRAINPVTKTNWEGVGVIPDIASTADDALNVALREARKAIDEGRRNRHGS